MYELELDIFEYSKCSKTCDRNNFTLKIENKILKSEIHFRYNVSIIINVCIMSK